MYLVYSGFARVQRTPLRNAAAFVGTVREKAQIPRTLRNEIDKQSEPDRTGEIEGE